MGYAYRYLWWTGAERARHSALQCSYSHRVGVGVQEHDEVLWPGVPVFDLALVAVRIHRQLGDVETLRRLLHARLGGDRHGSIVRSCGCLLRSWLLLHQLALGQAWCPYKTSGLNLVLLAAIFIIQGRF